MVIEARETDTTSINGPWKLPQGWYWQTIGSICTVNPGRPRLRRDRDRPTSFIPMTNVDEIDGIVSAIEIRPYSAVAHGFTYFEENDVLFAKITPSMQNGKCAIARGLLDGLGFGSTEFHVLRPSPRITSRWLHYYLRRLELRLDAQEHFVGAVGQQRVPEEFLSSSLIPVPDSIDIQNRVADRIEVSLADLKAARKTLLDVMKRNLDQVMEAVLKEVLEDLEKYYPSTTLGNLISNHVIRSYSGGTPPTNDQKYWNGPIPWVSPKDMKRWYIDDSQEHVSAIAVEENKTKLIPRGSVLLVVRGMILARDLPIGINLREVTINQDMKAFHCTDDLVPEYLGYMLRARAPLILDKVEIAGHGTRRLKMETLEQVAVPNISKEVQTQVIANLDATQSELTVMQNTLKENDEWLRQVEQAILQEAFRGEL